MIRFQTYLVLLFLLVCSLGSQAQYKSTKYNMANELYNQQKYFECIDLYLEVLKTNPNQDEVVLKLAKLYEKFNDYRQSLLWYEELIKLKSNLLPEVEYKCANLLKTMGKYPEAIKRFENFNKTYLGFDKAIYARLVKIEIDGCKKAMIDKNNSLYKVDTMARINSTYTDLAPFMHKGKIYLTSIPSDSTLTYGETMLPENYLKIVYSEKDSIGRWKIPSSFIPKIVSDPIVNLHSVGGAFSNDGKRFYFSRCKTDLKGVNRCKIYATYLKDTIWQAAVELKGEINDVNEVFSSTHACVTENQKTKKDILYFSSNMPGSKGGYDIWECEVDEKFVCKNIKNLGTKINTELDEITPYYFPRSSTLYFSSNGQVGYGGFDVYACPLSGKKMGKIKHLEKPVNSNYDEFYYAPYTTEEAFMVSNRLGAKKYYKNYLLDDVFKVSLDIKKHLLVKTFIKDSIEKEILGSSIAVKNMETSELKTYQSNEIFMVNLNTPYLINALHTSYSNVGKEFTFNSDNEEDTLTVALLLEKASVEKVNPPTEIKAEIDSSKVIPSPIVKQDTIPVLLEKIVPKEEIATIPAPSDSIVKQVIQNPIVTQDSIPVLLEKAVPIDSIVAKNIPSDTLVKTEVPMLYVKEDTVPVVIEKVVPMEEIAAKSTPIETVQSKVTPSPQVKEENIVVEQESQSQEIALKNIYFDFDSASLKMESKLELDTLYQIIQNNPSLLIEIGAHTDGKGSIQYNVSLSKKRAQSVVKYLVSKGANPSCLIAKGYGPNQPIAPNNNADGSDNPEGRALNRRIAFKIIKKSKTNKK